MSPETLLAPKSRTRYSQLIFASPIWKDPIYATGLIMLGASLVIYHIGGIFPAGNNDERFGPFTLNYLFTVVYFVILVAKGRLKRGRNGIYPVIRRVHQMTGQYVKDRPEGIPWFAHAEFSHRTHRMLECSSCHQQAKGSTKTSDVLIPKMASCLPCHGASGTALDNCTQCHLYHDKTREEDRERRTMQQVFESQRPARRTPIEVLRSVLKKK